MKIFFYDGEIYIFADNTFWSSLVHAGSRGGAIRLQKPFYGFVNGDSGLPSQIMCLNFYKL